MTTTPPSTEGPTGPRVSADELRDLARLRRSRTDRKIAGVAGGLGRHLDVDPVILRVAFVVLVFFGGAGLLLYGAMWLLVPEDGEEDAKIHLDPRTRTAALIIAGVLAVLALVGDSWGGYGFPWPVVVIGGLVALVLANRDRRTHEGRGYAATTAAPQGTTYPMAGTDDTTVYATGYEPAASTPYAPPPRKLSKREKYGPSLFLPTLALIAVALGALRVWELADHHVVDGAYPALALAITGAALVFGAWVGRAGAVLWLAIFAGIGMGATNVADNVGSTVERPLTADAVHSSYDLGVGRLVLDLSDVADPGELDGRTITLDGNIGQLKVIVPAEVNVSASGDISGGGRIEMFGRADDGDNPHLTLTHAGRLAEPGAAQLTIKTDLDFGNIYITEEAR
jgi:phage shock protein PspC (stress-responsive transcriptional regulator)